MDIELRTLKGSQGNGTERFLLWRNAMSCADVRRILLAYWTVYHPSKHPPTFFYFSLFPTWYTVFPSTYNICYPLSSTCFRPHRPIIRRSKLYMQPIVFSPSADVFVVRPHDKDICRGGAYHRLFFNLSSANLQSTPYVEQWVNVIYVRSLRGEVIQ